MVTAASALPTPSASLALGRARTSRAASASPRCAARQTPPPPPTTTPSWRVASSSRAVTTRTGARGGEASCSASYRTLPSRRERGGRGRGRHRGGGGGGATRVASAASATKRASATPQTIARSDGSPSSSSSSRLERPVGNSSTAQAMANSVNILLGVGLLSVPYALQVARFFALSVVAAACRVLLGVRNHVEIVQDAAYWSMLGYWRRRPRHVGLITVSNHVSSLDDPGLIAAITPVDVLLRPSKMRWSIATQDLVFPKGRNWIQAFMVR